jgi:hypothetical protein
MAVYCLATPSAVEHFLDLPALEALTGHVVRIGHQRAGQPGLPKADAGIVAPATCNTINKWAAGIADSYVLTQLAELTGLGVPIAVLPFVNTALAANRVFHRSVDELRAAGVTVLFGDGGFVPPAPRTGGQVIPVSLAPRPGSGAGPVRAFGQWPITCQTCWWWSCRWWSTSTCSCRCRTSMSPSPAPTMWC